MFDSCLDRWKSDYPYSYKASWDKAKCTYLFLVSIHLKMSTACEPMRTERPQENSNETYQRNRNLTKPRRATISPTGTAMTWVGSVIGEQMSFQK